LVPDGPAVLQGPGWRISEELAARGWNQKDLADVLGRPLQAVNEIVNANKQITPETAIQLGQAFDTSAEFWANLEAVYRVRMAKRTSTATEVERRSRLYALAPVNELIRRGWIEQGHSVEDLERALCDFLGIQDVDQEPTVPVVNLRHTKTRDPEARAQLAWVKRVEALVRAQPVAAYSSAKFTKYARELFDLGDSPARAARIPAALLELGVHFVVVPHLPKTYLDGAAFRTNGNPVIALTLRYDRLDHLLFTLAHEAAHVDRGDDGVLDAPPDRTDRSKDAKERAADTKASDWLIDPSAYASFLEATAENPTRDQIEAFAERINRHPSVVVGRLQHAEVISYSQHRWAHVSVRDHLANWIDQLPSR
jgi:HTH-type transcriptional regulator/antitoxin HigA